MSCWFTCVPKRSFGFFHLLILCREPLFDFFPKVLPFVVDPFAKPLLAPGSCEKAEEWRAALALLQQLQQWQLQATLITFSAAVSALVDPPMRFQCESHARGQQLGWKIRRLDIYTSCIFLVRFNGV